MRTPLAWTLRVTISPWNSLLPDFLKEPMVAISLLLGCSSPRPSRPRWRSTGRRRSTTHPQGRSTAEDGGGETFLAREEWAQPRGRKSRRRHCGKAIEALPSCGQITPSRGRAGRVPDSLARRRRGRHGPRKRSGATDEGTETLAYGKAVAAIRDQ